MRFIGSRTAEVTYGGKFSSYGGTYEFRDNKGDLVATATLSDDRKEMKLYLEAPADYEQPVLLVYD
jgi:hypothetical protein